MRTLILVFCCLFFSVCVAAYHRDSNPESWRGKNVQELVAAYGMPLFKSPAPKGNTYYMYGARRSVPGDYKVICPLRAPKRINSGYASLVAYEVDGTGVILKVKTEIKGQL